MKQEAAIKRERPMAYSLSAQQSRVSASPKSRTTKPANLLKNRGLDNKRLGWSLEHWMSTKPWENRLMEGTYFDPPDMTPVSRKTDDLVLPFHSYQEHGFVKARRNGERTRISAKSLTITSQSTPSSSASAISSDCMYDDSPVSTSYLSESPSLPSTNTLVEETAEESTIHKPSYMNLTESTKAKQRACRCSCQNPKRLLLEDCLSHSATTAFLIEDTRSYSDSDPSVNLWKGLCATPQRLSYQKRNSGRQRVAITMAGLV